MQGSLFPTPPQWSDQSREPEKPCGEQAHVSNLSPVDVLSWSLVVGFGLSAILSTVCAVLAWSNGQPRVVRALCDSMAALERDRAAWLQTMETFADAARHDLEQATEQKRKAQNTANRAQAREVPKANPAQTLMGDDDAGLQAVREYWAARS